MGQCIASTLQRRPGLRAALLNFALLGTCALVSDGILTPAISSEALLRRPALACMHA